MPPAVQSERAVTVLATRRVRDGAQPQFEDFLQRLPDVFASVTGFLGLTVLPPGAPSREYVLIYRFDSPRSLRAWRNSAQRRAVIAESSHLAETPREERSLTGMETWFASPGEGVVGPPARWKMWLLSTCGIYPIITAISLVAGPLLDRLPLLAGFAIVVPLLSAIMTWLVMPALSKLLAPLLYRR